MAKGAATQTALGELHNKVATIFTKVLDLYETRLQIAENIDPSEIEESLIEALMGDNIVPSPAMLSAITKFLKDNNIEFDTEQVAELSDQERRLAERLRTRPTLVDLSNLAASG